MQTQVRANDAHIVGHNLIDLLHTLGDKHFLLVGHCALIVPLRYLLIEVVVVDVVERVLGSCISVDHSLDE